MEGCDGVTPSLKLHSKLPLFVSYRFGVVIVIVVWIVNDSLTLYGP